MLNELASIYNISIYGYGKVMVMVICRLSIGFSTRMSVGLSGGHSTDTSNSYAIPLIKQQISISNKQNRLHF